MWFAVRFNKRTQTNNKPQVNLLELERLEILEKWQKRLIEYMMSFYGLPQPLLCPLKDRSILDLEGQENTRRR